MRTRFSVFLLVIVSFCIFNLSCQIQAIDSTTMSNQGWVQLGTKTVDFQSDTDIVPVALHQGMFRFLQIVVRNNPIKMNYIKVVYGNGESETFKTRNIYTKNTRSRSLNLKGFVRFIKHIEINYKSIRTGQGPAIVEFWARK